MFSFHAENSFEEHQRGPKPKRLKISIACNVCKAKKTKCDGARPGKQIKRTRQGAIDSMLIFVVLVCGPCAKRKQSSQACIYREADPVSPSSNIP